MAIFHSIIAPNRDHLFSIGRVTVQWTFLEHTIEFLVWQLAGLKQPFAQCITAQLQAMSLFDIANSLSNELLKGSWLDGRLKDLLWMINTELRPKRNKIVHGIWGPTGTVEKIALMETTARGVFKFKVGEEMTAEDILQVASEIDSANFKLTQLSSEISSFLILKPGTSVSYR